MKRLVAITIIFLSPCIVAGSNAQSRLFAEDSPVEFGCQFHATDNFDRPAHSSVASSTIHYLDMMDQADNLETQLIQLDSTNELWSEAQTELLIEIAQVKQSIGDTHEARQLYEKALYNMRINAGVYTLEQLPIILDLMAWYMAEDDEFTDQLGDRALFLYEKAYTSDEQTMDLVAGLNRLIALRLGAHYSHERKNSIHRTKAGLLQDRVNAKIEQLVTKADPEVRDRVLRERNFHTRYDDLGRSISTPESGVDQVTGATGLILEEVQKLLRTSETGAQASTVRAKSLLDELHQNFEALEYVDRAALLDFTADYHLARDDIAQTIDSYERILKIRVLRPDYQLRSLRALGQLYENEERWNAALDSYNCWRQLSTKEDPRVFIGLANAYENTEENELAIYHLERYMESLRGEGEVADANLYLVLKELYYQIDDFDGAAKITREMTTLFK